MGCEHPLLQIGFLTPFVSGYLSLYCGKKPEPLPKSASSSFTHHSRLLGISFNILTLLLCDCQYYVVI